MELEERSGFDKKSVQIKPERKLTQRPDLKAFFTGKPHCQISFLTTSQLLF